VPVLLIVPSAAKVAQPGVPPADEIMRFVVEAVPFTDKRARGLVVPIPTLWLEPIKSVEVPERELVPSK
jgi:hypothetical protein